ncbi:hypothetical protein ACIBLB_25810 [Streptosporangium canum]|uniref:hypothetical protein n=1 Tax=Streptosporangium canum TaxID=324952 RepID=UPI00379C34DE
MVNHALIRAHAAAAGIDDTAFMELTGMSLAHIETVLRPDLMSITFVWHLAEVLGLAPEALITQADDTENAPPPSVDREHADDVLLQAVLIEYQPFSHADLTDILGWTSQRLDHALDALAARLTDTPLRLTRTADTVELVRDKGIIDRSAQRKLASRRLNRTLLSPREAQYLIETLRNDIMRPITGKDGWSHPAFLPLFCQDLADRRLIVLRHRPGNSDQFHVAVSAHPDILFALRLPCALSGPIKKDPSE